MSLRANIRQQLLTVWNGEPWYGSSSHRLLEGVTAAEAAAHPVNGVQSIWEIVLHMVAWAEEAASRVKGAKGGTPKRGDWPPQPVPPTDAAWLNTQKELLAARTALLEAVDQSHEEDLYLLVQMADGKSGSGTTRAATAGGLAEHDIHHLGQVSLLRRAVRATVKGSS
jgi:uncharacterized damage-inducible protein DinB